MSSRPSRGGSCGFATSSTDGLWEGYIGLPYSKGFSRPLLPRPLRYLHMPQGPAVIRDVHRAVEPLLHHHLLCPYPVLYLVEPAVVGHGIVVPYRAPGLYAQIPVHVKVFGKPCVHVRWVRRTDPEHPVVLGQIFLEKFVGLVLRLYPLQP